MLRLVELGATGTYHLTNSGATSWYDLAVAAIRARGLAVDVVPITTGEYPTPAVRPAYSVLENRAWRDLGEPPLPDWEDGLRAYLTSIDAGGPR
jgi:dTDP-4-dehydrorhamnose reductase